MCEPYLCHTAPTCRTSLVCKHHHIRSWQTRQNIHLCLVQKEFRHLIFQLIVNKVYLKEIHSSLKDKALISNVCLLSDECTLIFTINLCNTVLHVSNLIPVHLQGLLYFKLHYSHHSVVNLQLQYTEYHNSKRLFNF